MTKHTIILAGLLMLAAGCSHPAPPVAPNHAIEYVSLLDHGARCEDWRRGLGPDAALCTSGDSLFWCAAPADAKPHCDLLYAPPPKPVPQAPVSPAVITPSSPTPTTGATLPQASTVIETSKKP